MNLLPDYPNPPFNLVVRAAGIALFAAAVGLLGLGITDLLGSVPKSIGAAILFFGCDELAASGWRAWRRRRFRQVAELPRQ